MHNVYIVKFWLTILFNLKKSLKLLKDNALTTVVNWFNDQNYYLIPATEFLDLPADIFLLKISTNRKAVRANIDVIFSSNKVKTECVL